MKRFYIIAAIFACAVSVQAAQLYYQFPDATVLNNADRMLIYQNNSGSKNLTGARLKQEILKNATVTGFLNTVGTVSINGTNKIYWCNAGVNAGLLARGNTGPCAGGTWVATSLMLD